MLEDTPTAADLSPEQVIADITGLKSQLGELSSLVRESLVTGQPAEASAPQTGLKAFSNDDGSLRLLTIESPQQFNVGGTKVDTLVTRPGLFDAAKAEDSGLSGEERAATKRFGRALSVVNVLRASGCKVMPRQQLADLQHAAKTAPPSLRRQFGAIYEQAETGFGNLVSRQGQFSDQPVSSAQSSGNPAYQWVADTYIEGVLDATDQDAGLVEMLLAGIGGDAGLHPTAATKVRVMTGAGGMRKLGRKLSSDSSTYPATTFDTDTKSTTGEQQVASFRVDEVDRSDPRALFDAVQQVLRAGRYAVLASEDAGFIHGEEESTVAAHIYGATGLQALAWDGRDANAAGQLDDPLLLEDGLVALATDRSNNKDVVAGTSLSAAADAFSSVANFVIAHRYGRSLLDAKYKKRSVVLTSQLVVDAIFALSVQNQGQQPLFIMATEAQMAANPWLAGFLYDGTPVMVHEYVTSKWNSSGVIASAGTLDAMLYVNPAPLVRLVGARHGAQKIETIPASDETRVSTFRNSRLWLPRGTDDKPVAQLFNLDA